MLSGGTESAMREELPEDRAQPLVPAANLRLVKHGAALHEECPPKLAQLFQCARAERLHAEARFAQRLRSGMHGGARFRCDRNEAIVLKESDGAGAQFIQARRSQRQRRARQDRAGPARSECGTKARRRRWCAPWGRSRPESKTGPRMAADGRAPGMRPGVGLSAQMPVKCAGMRTEPPLSLPRPAADMPAAMAADSPPLDPPGERSRSHGFRVAPCNRFAVS